MRKVLRRFIGLLGAGTLAAALGVVALPGPAAADHQLAFPGAEGFGRFAHGGRGGAVIKVTNLNNAGTGSLRACMEAAAGPRTCIFEVSGTIDLTERMFVDNPFLTVAGQTAPGGGIQLKGHEVDIRTHDVIVRYLKARGGHISPPTGPAFQKDAFNILGPSEDVIVDHSSFSYGCDETMNVAGGGVTGLPIAKNITVQDSIIAHGLRCGEDTAGTDITRGGGVAPLDTTEQTGLSMIRNLYAHNQERNPNMSGGYIQFVNNVIYDWGSSGTQLFPHYAALKTNMIGNYWKRRPVDPTTWLPMRALGDEFDHCGFAYCTVSEEEAANTLIYLNDNFDTVKGTNQTGLVNQDFGGLPLSTTQPFNFPSVTTMSAQNAYNHVLANVGATLPARDALDAEVIADVTNGTGEKNWQNGNNTQAECFCQFPPAATAPEAYWPNLAGGTPPADTDDDGMPDSWETANGLNPSDPADRNQDPDSDGYTNLEEYLNDTDPGGTSGSGGGGEVVLDVAADAFVQGGVNADTNYGGHQLVSVINRSGLPDQERESYLRFDLSGLSGSVTSATVKLYVAFAGSSSFTTEARSVANDSWQESAITWNNKPTSSGVLDTWSAPAQGTYVNVDVTSAVNAVLASGTDDDLSLHVLIPTAGSFETFTSFASKESTNPAPEHPTLNLGGLAADALVQGGVNADTNYGDFELISVINRSGLPDQERESYLRFDLSGLSGSVTSATVKLYVAFAGSSSFTTEARSVANDSWQESTITWNDKPTSSGVLDTWSAPAQGTYVNVDVTSAVNAVLASGTDDDLSLHLVIPTAGSFETFTSFASKEATNPAEHPTLTLN